MVLNVIWTQSPQSLVEAGWIRWLLRDFDIVEYVSPSLDVFKSNSIYILSSNNYPFSKLPTRFLEGVAQTSKKGLFHLSDEWYSGHYQVYSQFDFVLRNYHSDFFNNPAIKTVPLGPSNNAMDCSGIKLATNRRYLWSFAGAKSAARMVMVKHLGNVEPHQCAFFDSRRQQKPVLDQKAFIALLSDSVFSPCPMGNVLLETFRVYESLELGCIPIVERRPWMSYFDRLMPGHPLPAFSSWRKARQFVEELSTDGSGLRDYQHVIGSWWQSYKLRLRTDVGSFVSQGLAGSLRSSLMADWRCPTGISYQMWRLVELLRHATMASLQERIGLHGRRAVDRLLPPRR